MNCYLASSHQLVQILHQLHLIAGRFVIDPSQVFGFESKQGAGGCVEMQPLIVLSKSKGGCCWSLVKPERMQEDEDAYICLEYCIFLGTLSEVLVDILQGSLVGCIFSWVSKLCQHLSPCGFISM